MSTQAEPNPADGGALSLDQFVGVLDAAAAAPAQEEEADGEAAEAAPADVAEEEDVAEDIEALEDEEILEEEEREQLPPPKSWAAEDHAAWAELTPKAQEVVLKREADRDRAVAEATSKAGRAAAEVKQLADNYTRVAAQTQDYLTRAANAWQQKWGNVDWARYARESPRAYVEDKAQAEQERQDLIDYANHQTKVQAEADRTAKLAREAFLTEEWTKLGELSPELADPEKGTERRKEVIEYLGAQGFQRDVLADISAVEMTLARKAMLWDNAQKAAKAQAAIPRKNPASTAKPVPTGAGGVATPSSARVVAAANARLSKNGGINDLVALFDAEDAHKAKRATRK